MTPIALILALCALIISPAWPLTYFAPVLATCIQRHTLLQTAWLSALLGLSMDLLSFDTHFGLFALLLPLSTLPAYRFRNWFYENRLLSLPLLTGLISTTFVLLKALCLLPTPLWVPLLDMAYAFFWFSCPLFLYSQVTRRRYS